MRVTPHGASRLVVIALLVLGVTAPLSVLEAQEPATLVFLVRHAEKADDGTDDPPLTHEGAERARTLVHVLGDAGIERIFSTHYERARATAEPLAKSLGRDIELYDPGDLEGFARQLRSARGRYLVSGHSNTTPALVALLGGDPGTEIYEPTEYDRLYVVTLREGLPTGTTLLRFGELSAVP